MVPRYQSLCEQPQRNEIPDKAAVGPQSPGPGPAPFTSPRLPLSWLQPLIFPIDAMLAPQPSGAEGTFLRFLFFSPGKTALSLRKTPKPGTL